jgi:hypothetical protein
MTLLVQEVQQPQAESVPQLLLLPPPAQLHLLAASLQ